jgi:dTDP-4-amino-4,6-dideoxygalactose transaminase
VEGLQDIADRYGLKLFYDAAHAFGVRIKDTSVLKFGDLSMLSFHATKVFNTAEGGALITTDPKLKRRIDYLKNFGFADEVTVVAPGTNGKMNELQAALGVVQLRHVDEEIRRRRALDALYRKELAGIPGIRLLPPVAGAMRNYAYFPIFIDDASYPISRDALYALLRERGFLGRRYFFPLISEFPTYRRLPSSADLPAATILSRQVLCLPIYASLEHQCVEAICEIIREVCLPSEGENRDAPLLLKVGGSG